MSRKIAWSFMALLSVLVATYAAALLFVPAARPAFLQRRLDELPIVVHLHLGASAIAMAVGPFQFSVRLRERFQNAHRWSGRAYVIGVLLGGIAGLAMSRGSQGGTPGDLGFAFLAGAWLLTTVQAYRSIRSGDVAAHRRWMTRSFALTFAAVTLRIYLPISMALQLPFDAAYPVIAWLCWVPNLLTAEWMLRREKGASRRREMVVVS